MTERARRLADARRRDTLKECVESTVAAVEEGDARARPRKDIDNIYEEGLEPWTAGIKSDTLMHRLSIRGSTDGEEAATRRQGNFDRQSTSKGVTLALG
ncbi:hypothetical protein KPH14_008680 [Odynerus spinipes]|uniref:Uncharacterized protein n=1 Tax=Odynerus spinipes TaxID=1348599 RepID=A0AAD9VM99_9HYME|nr:hypothetical protein KPH14_008680 [Odynerus spinipes]